MRLRTFTKETEPVLFRTRYLFVASGRLAWMSILLTLTLLLLAAPSVAEAMHERIPDSSHSYTDAQAAGPRLLSATTSESGDVIYLDFDKAISNSTPLGSTFTLLVDGSEVAIVNVGVLVLNPKRVGLGLNGRIYAGEVVTLSYADPTAGNDIHAIQDTDGNDAESFNNVSVTNNSPRVQPVATLSASPGGPNSIWLEWELTGDGRNLVGYDLQYSDDGGNSFAEVVDYTGDRARLQYTMHRGLQPATTYAYTITPIFSSTLERPDTSEAQAVTESQPPAVQGLTYTGEPQGRSRVKVDFCWVPEGEDVEELTDLQYGLVYFKFDENSAMPWEDDGMFTFSDVTGASCSSGDGIGISRRYLANLNYYVRLRAMKDGELIESNEVVVNVNNPNVTLKSRILAEGFYGRGPDGELVFPDVASTVSGPFEVAVGFGYHFPMDASTTDVTGLETTDFEVTNATISEPEDGFEYEDFIGYRLLVTPTSLGSDITLKVKAGSVMGSGTSSPNLASGTFRRRTTSP